MVIYDNLTNVKTSVDKHAFLIMAHDSYEQLGRLIAALDDERNDIFVHIDKKSVMPKGLTCRKAGLFFCDNRIDVRWGDISQILAELELFGKARSTAHYRYYHLLSGSDLPIKSMDNIHEFMAANDGKEFVGFADVTERETQRKIVRYRFFTRHFRSNSFAVRYGRKVIEAVVNLLVKRPDSGMTLKKGANWVSITDKFCEYLLAKRCLIMKMFRHTCCPDEYFVQTLLWNSDFRGNIYSMESEFQGCMRLIDWHRGSPYLWGGGTRPR